MSENFVQQILYVNGPEGMSVLNMFDPEASAPKDSVVIDSGAAVSVAPKHFDKISPINRSDKIITTWSLHQVAS